MQIYRNMEQSNQSLSVGRRSSLINYSQKQSKSGERNDQFKFLSNQYISLYLDFCLLGWDEFYKKRGSLFMDVDNILFKVKIIRYFKVKIIRYSMNKYWVK